MVKNDNRLHDLVSVNLETVQLMFSNYDPSIAVVDAEQIFSGMSTSNFIVFTGNEKKKFLLRIYPESNDHSNVEVAAYNHAKQFCPVPEIYFCDNSRTIIPETYVIMQYMDGLPLGGYLLQNNGFPDELAFAIGSQLSLLHNRKYDRMALLNAQLSADKILVPVCGQYELYLNGYAGKHIDQKLRSKLLAFACGNKELLQRLSEPCVLSHGDFIFSNILVDSSGAPWFIDFEYCLAAPPCCDIGKFFRTRKKYEKYMSESVCRSFMDGYDSKATKPLPEDWLLLSRIADMASMLALINREAIPDEWVDEIEEEINKTMDMVNSVRS